MNLLRSRESTLTVLVVALLAQIPHAAYVFSHIGDQQDTLWNLAHGYAYAVALELAVLLFVVRNRQYESYGFAFVSIAINLCYYAMHDVAPFQLQAFPAWLVSVALPVAIACYSHDIAHDAIATQYRIIDSAIEPVALQLQEPTQLQSPNANPLQECILQLQGNAKSKYLQLRAMGEWSNAEICKALQIKNATGASWWSRAQAQGAD